MLHQSLVSYIRAQLANGAKLLEIKDVLSQSGWSEADIYDAFSHIQQIEKSTAPPIEKASPPAQKKAKPKITFSSSRMGMIVVLLLFCLTIGAIFVYYFQNQHTTQTASDISLPPDIR